MSWLSWLSLILAVVAFSLSLRVYLRARRQQKLAEEQHARVEAALKAWNAAIRRMNGGK